MNTIDVSRRSFLAGAGAVAAGALTLRYGSVSALAQEAAAPEYRGFEDVMRQKWTWDKVVHSSHGTNCTGSCAFNVFVKNGIAWREEQQAEYGSSGDVPDYGPRGCQKGLRHSKYMYGPQRVLYPMKRAGERGEGKWERVTWEQALDEIADKFIDVAVEDGPEAISYDLGTQMVVKRSCIAGTLRFSAITGVAVPESFAGVGDQPLGIYMTFGLNTWGDTMAAIYKSRACLIWMSNPAITRIPDAHFFWEARYNGTKVTAISPEFTATAMHANRWLNPKPGTDSALAMAMVQTVLEDKTYDVEYIREQTDLPFLVRTDDNRFLRATDMEADGGDTVFYMWDETTGAAVKAPATGGTEGGSLALGDIVPALEGTWTVETANGPVEVTTVFEMTKKKAAEYTPELAQEITGVNPEVVRTVAREFAAAKPAMIFSGYASSKWLHGDLLQRAMLLLLSLTGNIGPEGSGLQVTNLAKKDGILAYVAKDIPPAMRLVSGEMFDYEQCKMNELNRQIYGDEFADELEEHYTEAGVRGYIPNHAPVPWRMGFFAGCNPVNWRASGNRWRAEGFDKLETIVAMTPDMSATAHNSDYVLPIASHYERQDMLQEPRTPYLQVIDAAVAPLGESLDDWTILKRLCETIGRRATERGIAPIEDNFMGNPLQRDYSKAGEHFTLNGTINETKDVVQLLIDATSGIPKMSFDELAAKGLVRVNDSETTQFGEGSPYNYELTASVYNKVPYQTLTARQQYYFDHEWFIKFGEALPTYRPPMKIEGYPLQMMMGHARHGIHSMWRDDSLLVSLQRGEPDIFINPDDAAARGVKDGDQIKVFNPLGDFIVQAHVSAGVQPGMMFMFHGWDPMMFKNQKNFSAVISTGGLIKPTNIVGDYGHLSYRPLFFTPNQTFKDFTCNFEKYVEEPDDQAL